MPKTSIRFDNRVGGRVNAPLRGVALSVLSMLLFACSDVVSKYLNRTLPPVEIAWIRYVIFCLVVVPIMVRRGPHVLRSARPWLQALRALGLAGTTVFFIIAVRYLPVAEATATHFICPLFITALSIPILGETVGWRRWCAAAVGLVGVVVVVRPMGATFQAASLLPVLSAICSACAMVLTRKLAGTDSTATTLVWSAFVGFLLVTVLLPFGFVVPGPMEMLLGLGVGVGTSVAHWLVVLAYRYVDASLLAQLSYVQIIMAAILGFVVFNAAPDSWSYVGAGLIIASGLYTAHRERLRRRTT
jgi:drug/metabolite transporter (DMT)-like permease